VPNLEPPPVPSLQLGTAVQIETVTGLGPAAAKKKRAAGAPCGKQEKKRKVYACSRCGKAKSKHECTAPKFLSTPELRRQHEMMRDEMNQPTYAADMTPIETFTVPPAMHAPVPAPYYMPQQPMAPLMVVDPSGQTMQSFYPIMCDPGQAYGQVMQPTAGMMLMPPATYPYMTSTPAPMMAPVQPPPVPTAAPPPVSPWTPSGTVTVPANGLPPNAPEPPPPTAQTPTPSAPPLAQVHAPQGGAPVRAARPHTPPVVTELE
jgi:hypothetical protein